MRLTAENIGGYQIVIDALSQHLSIPPDELINIYDVEQGDLVTMLNRFGLPVVIAVREIVDQLLEGSGEIDVTPIVSLIAESPGLQTDKVTSSHTVMSSDIVIPWGSSKTRSGIKKGPDRYRKRNKEITSGQNRKARRKYY